MDNTEILKSIVGFALGAIVTYLGLHWKIRQGLVAQYDKDLRAERLRVYLVLWALTEPLATYSPPGIVSKQTLSSMSRDLRHWYFATGGLFLSERSRDAYFDFQKAILAAEGVPDKPSSTEIDKPIQAILRTAASKLRTALTADIGSRMKPAIENESDA